MSSINYENLKEKLLTSVSNLELFKQKKIQQIKILKQEIGECMIAGRHERARIRVEYVIREDHMIEGLEIIEMYCDLLLARFSMISNMKELDESIADAVASLIWVAPRFQSEIEDLSVVADLLGKKYGTNLLESCRKGIAKDISEKLKSRLCLHSPPQVLIEKYLSELAKIHNIEPPTQVTESGNQSQAHSEDKIKEIIQSIREQKKQLFPESSRSSGSSGKNKRLKVDMKKTFPKRISKIYIGWLHKKNDKYIQVKKTLGGIRILEIQEDEDISVAKLLDMMKNIFFDKDNIDKYSFLNQNSNYNLGNFDGTKIESFQNKKGEICTMWEYLKCRGLQPSRHHFYLLTDSDNLEQLGAVKTQNNNPFGLDEFKLEYLRIVNSKYSKFSIIQSFLDTQSCIDVIVSEYPEMVWDHTEHSVLDFGFQICNISSGTKCYVNIDYCDELNQYEFKFPSFGKNDIVPHSLLYDIHAMIGMYEGNVGLCVICSCTYECKPIFRWYFNDIHFKEGYIQYVITLFQNGKYFCEIECSQTKIYSAIAVIDFLENQTTNPSNIIVSKEFQTENTETELGLEIEQNPLELPAICKENLFFSKNVLGCGSQENVTVTPSCSKDFRSENTETELGLGIEQNPLELPAICKENLFFSKKVLGCGNQGKVREGVWLGTDVAIKTIYIGKKTLKTSSALREIHIHTRLRHPNIVQIMGVCFEKSNIHIVMELVRGDSLHNIIFDSTVKNEYRLDEAKKVKLALQICQAVNYLHKQLEPIIHRDIKPLNILVSYPSLNAKICDLGLSKLDKLSNLSKTIGSAIKGTPMYMPPEMFLYKEIPTAKCDVWSLACTLIELFTESDVWDLDDDEIGDEELLRSKMLNFEMPNTVLAIPAFLQGLISQCLSYTPEKRPEVQLLLYLLKESMKDE